MDFLSGENIWYFSEENPYPLNGFTVQDLKKIIFMLMKSIYLLVSVGNLLLWCHKRRTPLSMLIFFLPDQFFFKTCWLCTVAAPPQDCSHRPSTITKLFLSSLSLVHLTWKVRLRFTAWCCRSGRLRIVMMVLVRALCHQQEEWLGPHQHNVSLTDGNTWS